ncbi:MAG: hypothetical protein ACOCWG_05940, partial [bacterium]
TSALSPLEVAPPPMRKSINYGEVNVKGANTAHDIVQMINAAGFITQKGIVNIGSIGSRKTNWDTSYNLHIDGISSSVLQKILTWFTDISNKNITNIVKSKSKETFDLTQAKEVHDLMQRLGIENIFHQTVDNIKQFEEQKGLKSKYKKYGYIPDYQKNTKKISIPLKNFETQIFEHLRKQITNNPKYVNILANEGVKNTEELLAAVFSMGEQGEILSIKETDEIMQMAA